MRGDMCSVMSKGSGCGSGKYSRKLKYGWRWDDEDVDAPVMRAMRRDGGGRSWRLKWGPMRRYLCSKVGQRWDVVWSDITHNVPDSVVRSTVSRLVCIKTQVVDGRLVCADGSELYYDFAVDASGVLVAVSRKSRKSRKSRACKGRDDVVVVGEFVQCHRVGGVWYRVDLGVVPKVLFTSLGGFSVEGRVVDVLFGAPVSWVSRFELEGRYGRVGVFGVGKRQLSRRELRVYGLRNG